MNEQDNNNHQNSEENHSKSLSITIHEKQKSDIHITEKNHFEDKIQEDNIQITEIILNESVLDDSVTKSTVKKKRKCTICRSTGHTKLRCSQNIQATNNLTINTSMIDEIFYSNQTNMTNNNLIDSNNDNNLFMNESQHTSCASSNNQSSHWINFNIDISPSDPNSSTESNNSLPLLITQPILSPSSLTFLNQPLYLQERSSTATNILFPNLDENNQAFTYEKISENLAKTAKYTQHKNENDDNDLNYDIEDGDEVINESSLTLLPVYILLIPDKIHRNKAQQLLNGRVRIHKINAQLLLRCMKYNLKSYNPKKIGLNGMKINVIVNDHNEKQSNFYLRQHLILDDVPTLVSFKLPRSIDKFNSIIQEIITKFHKKYLIDPKIKRFEFDFSLNAMLISIGELFQDDIEV